MHTRRASYRFYVSRLLACICIAALVCSRSSQSAAQSAGTAAHTHDVSLEEAAVYRDADVCDFVRIDASTFTTERYFAEFHQRTPFVLTNYRRNEHFVRLTHVDELLRTYGHERILAASANTYSHTRMPMTFESYVRLAMSGPLTLQNESDATAYFFGDHDEPSQWSTEAEWADGIAIDEKMRACTNLSAVAESTLLAAGADCQATTGPARDGGTKRPIWSKLLRQYHPPPYVVPANAYGANDTDNGAASQNDPLDGVRRVKFSAAGHRAFFDEGDGVVPEPVTSSSSPLPPRYDYARYSFGLGSHRSGVPFHFHGAAIGEVFHGRKRWFLYPPAGRDTPFASPDGGTDSVQQLPFTSFRPELSQLQWLTHVYPTLRMEERPLQCTLNPHELIYVPGMWYHATMNLGPLSVFLSTFIDDARMEAVLGDKARSRSDRT